MLHVGGFAEFHFLLLDQVEQRLFMFVNIHFAGKHTHPPQVVELWLDLFPLRPVEGPSVRPEVRFVGSFDKVGRRFRIRIEEPRVLGIERWAAAVLEKAIVLRLVEAARRLEMLVLHLASIRLSVVVVGIRTQRQILVFLQRYVLALARGRLLIGFF